MLNLTDVMSPFCFKSSYKVCCLPYGQTAQQELKELTRCSFQHGFEGGEREVP